MKNQLEYRCQGRQLFSQKHSQRELECHFLEGSASLTTKSQSIQTFYSRGRAPGSLYLENPAWPPSRGLPNLANCLLWGYLPAFFQVSLISPSVLDPRIPGSQIYIFIWKQCTIYDVQNQNANCRTPSFKIKPNQAAFQMQGKKRHAEAQHLLFPFFHTCMSIFFTTPFPRKAGTAL